MTKCKECGQEKPQKRCIESEIIDLHLEFARIHGMKHVPTRALIGETETKLFHESLMEINGRIFRAKETATLAQFLEHMARGELEINTIVGRLRLYAVDTPSHLSLGWDGK